LWMAARTRSDAAKLVVLWWALLAFVASGFEHSIANATVFALGVFEGSATWSMLARNLAWTVPGNLVGGGLLVGLAYAWMGRASIRRPGVALTPRAATPGEPVAVAPATPALANAAVATDLAGG
jgi:nitrite transporter NirC